MPWRDTIGCTGDRRYSTQVDSLQKKFNEVKDEDLALDIYFLLLVESGELIHFNGNWVGADTNYKRAMLALIDIGYYTK